MNEQTILHPDQVDELRRLLGTIEDWLLHASVETIDELGGFLRGLGGLGGSVAGPEQLVTWLIHDLGERTLTLRPGSGTGSAARSGGTEPA
jgi:hypothetical protein